MKKLQILVIAVLFMTTIGATGTAFHYRNLYSQKPKIKTVTHNSIIHQTEFDPNRSQAYTCTPQNASPNGVGMICTSPDRNIEVSCTTTAGEPVEYFC